VRSIESGNPAMMQLPILLAALAAVAPGIAQEFPARTVRIVAPFAAGGGGDVNARRLAERLTRAWGKSVVVENVTGAAGNVGAAAVAKAAPDGYTLIFASHPILTANQWLYPRLPFDADKDFAPVIHVSDTPHVLLAHPALPAAGLAQLIALAKRRPGELAFGSGGAGTSTHLATELLKVTAGIDLVHVPYRGAAPAVTALMSGEVQLLFDSATTAIGHVRGKRVRGIAVASAVTLPALPEVPTFAAAGLRDFTAGVSHGILAPAATPAAVIALLNREINQQINTRDYRGQMADLGVQLVGGTPEAFRDYLAAERRKWGNIIRSQGLRTE
jgi:tripartite-type tricarboxylate transporter receptor subunit TctC